MTSLDSGAGDREPAAAPAPREASNPGVLPHELGVAGAIITAILLIGGALFGYDLKLSALGIAGVDQTLRLVCVAAWALLIPAWFTLEEMIWAPPTDDPKALERFRRGQRAGHYTITLVGAIVFAIVLGVSPAPSTPAKDSPAGGAPAAPAQH